MARSSRRHSLRGREPQGADVKPVERTGEGGGPGLQAERLASRVTWGRPSSIMWTRRAGARPLREPDPENMHNQELLEGSHKVWKPVAEEGALEVKSLEVSPASRRYQRASLLSQPLGISCNAYIINILIPGKKKNKSSESVMLHTNKSEDVLRLLTASYPRLPLLHPAPSFTQPPPSETKKDQGLGPLTESGLFFLPP